MTTTLRIPLAAVFWASVIALATLVLALFFTLRSAAQKAVDDGTEIEARVTAVRTRDSINGELERIERTVDGFADAIRAMVVDRTEPDMIAAELLRPMIGDARIAETAFTWGPRGGAEGARGQITVRRSAGGRVRTRTVVFAEGRRSGDVRERESDSVEGHVLAHWTPARPTERDPTDHPTFTTPASRIGVPVWSELSWLQSTGDDKRVGVSVQRGIDLGGGRVGVARTFVETAALDRIVEEASRRSTHVFVVDPRGRLLMSPGGAGRLVEDGGDLRIDPAAAPSAITRAHRTAGEGVHTIGETLVVQESLHHPHGWRVGVVADLEFFRGELGETLRTSTWLAAGVVLVVIAGGVITLRLLRASLATIAARTRAMETFDMSPADAHSPITEVRAALASLEGAKAAMRAMGRYVPVELIRRIYSEQREPTLGGANVHVTVMFTDIAGFTTWAEATPPDELAAALGRYFETVAGAVARSGGIVDKYIGDAVMALWNVPDERPGHAAAACRTALEVSRATAELFASEKWRGEPLTTRIGLHTADVLVGHFGAPDRLDYTALGDGVNIAARLESLNKTYGTTIIASRDTVEEADDAGIRRRLLDEVVVKGRSRALEVYELLAPGHDADAVEVYGEGRERYRAGAIEEALALFESIPHDPPARALAARCRELLANGVPDDWDGVWRATEK